MKTKLLVTFILFSTSILSAQKFQSGYYIDNAGTKIEGFIKDNDSKNNPKSFEFKKNDEDNSTVIALNMCQEFSVNSKKYLRSTVEIEKSSTNISTLSKKKDPAYVTETLFLKNLVSGKYNLYYYYNQGNEKFFFSDETKKIIQLIYIQYIIDSEDVKYKPEYKNYKSGSVLTNDAYKKQLWENVKCDVSNMSDINNLEFTKSQLQNYFTKINTCNGSIETITSVEKKSIVSIKAGVIFNNDKFSFTRNTSIRDSSSKTNFGIGADLEILMPFNNYRWSIFIEPNYSKFKESKNIQFGLNGTLTQKLDIDLNVIQIPIGARYYFGNNNHSKVYLGSGLNITNLKKGSKIDLERSSDIELANFTYTFFGSLGYKFKSFVAEARINSVNNISAAYGGDTQFSRLSFSIKYEFLRK